MTVELTAVETALAAAKESLDTHTAQQITHNANLTIAMGTRKMATRANEEVAKQATENIKAAGAVLKEMKFS